MIQKEEYIFGVLFLGDGDTISRTTILSILVSGGNIPVDVLELVDCQGHLYVDGIKDGTFIYDRFNDHIKDY